MKMTQEKLIKLCTEFEDGIVTYPFCEEKYGKIPVLRHKSNEKWYGLIFESDGELCINLKAKPLDVVILKDEYSDCIKPAWHMNKTHWIKIILSKINKELLVSLVENSYNLTASKKKCKN